MCLTTLKYKQHYIKRSVRIIKINNYRLMNQKQRQDTTKKEFITKLHSCKKRKNSIDAHLRLVGVLSTMYAGRRDLFSYLYFLLFRHSNFPTHPQCLHFISSLPCFCLCTCLWLGSFAMRLFSLIDDEKTLNRSSELRSTR